MRKTLLIFLLFAGFTAHAQFNLFNIDLLPLEQKVCPFDPLQQVVQPQRWLIYQTQDNLWNGPVDSTRCISADVTIFGGIKILLDQIDAAKPVFLRFETDLQPEFELLPNATYSIGACADMYPDSALFSQSAACEEGICSGAFIDLAIPDSNGVDLNADRIHTALANQASVNCAISSCFPTEKFTTQFLRRLVLKFSFPAGADLAGKFLNLTNIFLSANQNPGLISSVVGQPWDYTGSEYNVAAYEAATNGGFQTYLLQYTAATYPDAAHPSFVEATLSPNTSTQETINLIVSDFESLEIQPFTHLRGALVEGSDSVRHHANLINLGGEFCFNFLDVIFSDDNEYRHGGGRITINHPKSCMQFRDESRLHVLENATLRYGDEGAGMLVVCASAGITLDRGATLVMDGMLSLSECSDDPTPKSIVVDLPPGARLVFTDKALLTNQFSQFQQTTLTVRMLGGELDDSALSAEERALIHREYPVPKPGFDDNLQVFPNPFTVNPSVQYTTDEDEPLHIQWLNLNGQLIQESVFMAKKGANEWQPAAPAAAGVYLLVVEGKKGKTIRKVAGI